MLAAKQYKNWVKRLVDLVIAVPSVIILLPVYIIIGILLRIVIGSPVVFRQERPGLHDRQFCIYKFRTMTNARAANGDLKPDSERLTRFGQFLRSTSLDELPELINVIKGDMSIVGPRPLLMQYLKHYTPEQARRHEVTPGITGWAQVNGRNAITWEQKFELDVWYVDNWSVWLDVKIIAMTLVMVLKREGIAPSDKPIMPRFRGSKGQD